MENNEHFCIRHPFNGIKNWWFNNGLNEEIDSFDVFLMILIVIVIGLVCYAGPHTIKDNTDTSGCADSTCKITTLDIPTSKCFSETVYISE